MKKLHALFLVCLLRFLCLSTNVNAQDAETKKTSSFRLPVIGVAAGVMNFSGEIGYNKFNQPLTAKSGYQLEIQFPTENRVAFSLFGLMGNVFGEEKTINRAVNFKSSILTGGFQLRFDFLNKKRSDQVLVPFISAGVEYLMFKSKTDLKDAAGTNYNYWSDGSIRNIAENDPAADQSVVIYRDYNYETEMEDANFDGLEDYTNTTWGIPVGAGVRFNISERSSLHFSSVYHLTGTDFIDGITANSTGSRAGNSKNDNFLYTSVSFRFALSGKNKNDQYANTDFNALVNEDADGDGIVDLLDDSSGTPLNNAVDASGRPYDKDNDGIPDYRDLEPNTAADAIVNEKGVTITEEMIEEQFRKDSLAALPAVIEYLKSYDKLTQRSPGVEQRWIDKTKGTGTSARVIPNIYKPIDVDKNAIISPKEISTAIDDYLSRKSTYTVSEFFDLIDYFFSQN